MKSYIAGIIIGVLLFAGGYLFVRNRLYIPVSLQERTATEYQHKAIELEKQGKIKKAIKIYKKIVKRCPASSRAEIALFRIFEIYSGKDKRKMVEAANWYLKKFPKKRGSQVACRTGEYFLLEARDFEKAEKLFAFAVEQGSSAQWAVRSQERLSELYYRKNDYAKVIELNDKLIKSLGNKINADYYSLMNLKCYWRLGNQKKAYEEAKKIKNPGQPVVKNELLYWKVLEKFGAKSFEVMLSLGDAYARLGFPSKAAFYWKQAYKMKPKNKAVLRRMRKIKK
ncbi:MAG: tetratricopeptide repeat protein [Elusimicrobia bacterium]|nr:tetratricopeptide repeat protein [Elusimicrobiota bacterium]